MKFGVFDHLDRNDLPLADFYAQRLAYVELYDRLGFYGYHLAEHHGTPLGMASSPSVFLAAVARATTRLRFGPMVYLLPLYHPIRLAEEIAMLDQLGRGRLDVGVGRGRSPVELESFGLDPAASEALFDEALEIVKRALTDGAVTFAGKHYNVKDARLSQEVLQTPHPPFWYGIGTPASVDRCIASGFNVITIAKPDVARETARKYFEAASVAGLDLMFGVCRFVVVADTTDEVALAIARCAYPYWHKRFRLSLRAARHPAGARQPGSFDAMAELRTGVRRLAGRPQPPRPCARISITSVRTTWSANSVFGDMTEDESRSFDQLVLP